MKYNFVRCGLKFHWSNALEMCLPWWNLLFKLSQDLCGCLPRKLCLAASRIKTRHIWFDPLGGKVLDTFGFQSQIMLLIVFKMRLDSSPSMQAETEFSVGYHFLLLTLENFVSQICHKCFESKRKALGQWRGTHALNVSSLFSKAHVTNYRKTQ